MSLLLQSSETLGSQLEALQSEKAELVQSLSALEAELVSRGAELERAQGLLASERESGAKVAETLQNQLNQKVSQSAGVGRSAPPLPQSNDPCVLLSSPQESREQALESQLMEARWNSLQGALEEAQKIVQESLAQIDDPAHIGCTSSAGLDTPPAPASCSLAPTGQ